MAERPILGLRKNEKISAVREKVAVRQLVLSEPRRVPTDTDRITANIASAIGAEIPADFLLQSGLMDLQWAQIYHPNALSAIYLGFTSKYASMEEFRDAQAVIALHSRAIQAGRGSILDDGYIVQPQRLEVTTVLPDTTGKQRIISGTFNPDTKRIMTRFVSFGDTEMYAQPRNIWYTYEDRTPSKVPMGRLLNPDSIYGEVYPLVTPRMAEVSGDRVLADVGFRESHLRSLHKEDTGHEFVTTLWPDGKGPTTAWSIAFPDRLEPAA